MLRQVLPRVGYAAVGLIWITIGAIAARVGFLGTRGHVAGFPGALRFLLRQEEGPWVLASVAACLVAFAIWRWMQAVAGREGTIARIGQALTAVGYGVLAWTAVRLLLRLRSEGRLDRQGVAWVLAHPVGRLLLHGVGVVLMAAGLVAIVQGATGRLPKWLLATGLTRSARRFAARIARFGLAARGVVMAVVGYFLFRAAEDLDPQEVREIGGSLAVLSKSALGPFAMGIVAVGLVFYGISMWILVVSRRPA